MLSIKEVLKFMLTETYRTHSWNMFDMFRSIFVYVYVKCKDLWNDKTNCDKFSDVNRNTKGTRKRYSGVATYSGLIRFLEYE